MGNLESLAGESRGESLSEARRRLWREKRFEAFNDRFKELATGASTRTEQGRTAFYAALKEFPPAALPQDGPRGGSDPFLTPMPRFNDTNDLQEELPYGEGPIEDDIRWAYNMLPVYWDAACSNHRKVMRAIEVFGAPNLGAVQMLRAAYCDPVKFTLEVVPLMLGGPAARRAAIGETVVDRVGNTAN